MRAARDRAVFRGGPPLSLGVPKPLSDAAGRRPAPLLEKRTGRTLQCAISVWWWERAS